MTQITFSKSDDSYYPILLDKKRYNLRLSYNETFDYYTLGFYDEAKNPIVLGRKIVSGFPINRFDLDKVNMPDGLLCVVCTESRITHDNIFDEYKTKFYYVTKEDVA